eukprot:6345661-Amphidinium_carterae.1
MELNPGDAGPKALLGSSGSGEVDGEPKDQRLHRPLWVTNLLIGVRDFGPTSLPIQVVVLVALSRVYTDKIKISPCHHRVNDLIQKVRGALG